MDRTLADRLNALSLQNDTLKNARTSYLLKEAERKHFEATLISGAQGKSIAEKTINAQASEEWVEFHRELARLESAYEFEKLKYDILDKAYLAEHATFREEASQIRKQG